jgi:hypothetical protein
MFRFYDINRDRIDNAQSQEELDEIGEELGSIIEDLSSKEPNRVVSALVQLELRSPEDNQPPGDT